jgi:3-hydroxyisobutyrate dehydrogenase
MIGTRFGLDPEVMCDVINESTGMNSATKRNMKQHVISRKFSGGFAWDLKFQGLQNRDGACPGHPNTGPV